MNGRFLINRGDAKVMGVAAGLSRLHRHRPDHRPRSGFVALTLMTGPVMLFFYVVTGLLAPRPIGAAHARLALSGARL